MTKARPKPSTPAEIALRRETARLEAQGDIRIVSSPAHEIIASRRMDVFELLRSRGALHHSAYEAARRLERDYDAIHGGDRSEVSERIDCDWSAGRDDHRRAATARVSQVLAIVRPGSRRLLEALIGPQFAGILTRWRNTVATITGQADDHVQADRVRQAAEDLADAYESVDYQSRKRA